LQVVGPCCRLEEAIKKRLEGTMQVGAQTIVVAGFLHLHASQK
jgi:hypothetical protein